MFVRSLDGKEYPVMSTYTIQDEINGNIQLATMLESNRVNREYLHDLSEFWELVDDDEVIYKIMVCRKQGQGNNLTANVMAVPKIYDDLRTSRIYPRYNGSYAVDELFRIIFADSGYTYRMIGAWDNIKIENYGDGETRFSMFEKVLKRINAEFEFSGTSVTIREEIGSETDIMYRHRLNASNIVHEVDGQEFYTFMRGYGDYREDEKGWENAKLVGTYTSPLEKVIGRREGPPLKNPNILNSATLNKNLKERVDNSIKISVSANLIDLRTQNYPYAQSRLGDKVSLIDERIDFNEVVRVVKRSITKNWKGDIIKLAFTFGSQGMVERYRDKFNNTIKEVNDILEGRKKLPFQAMSDEIQLVSQLLKSVQTQLVVAEDGSLLAIDKKNPNLVVILNAAGIGISDDGGRTFKNALTGRGLLADAIMANSITADHLAVNAITVGFNRNSTNIKLFGDRIEFYSNNRKTAELDDRGMTFWYGTRQIGDLGEGYKTGQTSVRGINMRLHTQGDYIAWSHLKSINDSSYTTMMTMDPYGKMTGWQGIDVSMKMRVVDNDGYGHELHDALQVGWAFKGKTLTIPSRMNSDGTAAEWYNFRF